MISLYLLSLLMNSYLNYCFHECYCTLFYMYLQVIQINIIIIINYSGKSFFLKLIFLNTCKVCSLDIVE